jgi:hypothetical protein
VIVTLTMGANGYPPSLNAVDPAADPGILHAFTRGVDLAAVVLTTISIAVLVILVTWSWNAAKRRGSGAAADLASPAESAAPLPDRTLDP